MLLFKHTANNFWVDFHGLGLFLTNYNYGIRFHHQILAYNDTPHQNLLKSFEKNIF